MSAFKLDKDIRRLLITYTLANMLLLVVILGALMGGFIGVAAKSSERAVEKGVDSYVSELKRYTKDELIEMCKDGMGSVGIGNPSYMFGIYLVRGDNTYEFYSKYEFLIQSNPMIGGRSDAFERQSVGGYQFVTYTTAVKDSAGAYIKVFAPANFLTESDRLVKMYTIPFVIAFVILCAVIALLLGYIEIRPIAENYYKQKNFINDMSHEIRTPLSIIKGNLENIKQFPEYKISQVGDAIAECLDEVDYMNNMSSGLLSIVRGGNKSVKREALLSDAVADAVENVAELATMSNKSLIARIDNCDISVDKEKIKQLMDVLIENSLKYTDEGDRIDVKVKNTKEGCALIISDTGIGVGKNELDKIFDRFYRGENVGDKQGTGLGLAIAKTIVESMNGTIKAMHNVPKGLEIIVTLKRG